MVADSETPSELLISACKGIGRGRNTWSVTKFDETFVWRAVKSYYNADRATLRSDTRADTAIGIIKELLAGGADAIHVQLGPKESVIHTWIMRQKATDTLTWYDLGGSRTHKQRIHLKSIVNAFKESLGGKVEVIEFVDPYVNSSFGPSTIVPWLLMKGMSPSILSRERYGYSVALLQGAWRESLGVDVLPTPKRVKLEPTAAVTIDDLI